MTLPARRKRPPTGIERAPKREWPKHRAFVRRHQCVVPGCQAGPIQFAHLRTAANAGTSIKPHDQFGVSMCALHHVEQHAIGAPAFERRYGLDLFKLAAEFTAKSTDVAMRESLREAHE